MKRILVCLAAVSLLALSACGRDDKGAKIGPGNNLSGATATPTATETATATPTPSGVLISPNALTQIPFTGRIQVSISGPSGFQVRYEERGFNQFTPDPTCATGTVYSGPFLVGGPSETVHVKAVACDGGRVSSVATGTYTFGAPSSVLLSPSSANQNSFTQKVTVSISGPAGMQIRYEEKGYNEVTPDPTCATGTVYSGPFLVGGPSETVHVKAIACENDRASPITTGTYTFGSPGSPTLNPPNGNRNPYTGKISVSMSATAGFQIRYEDIGYNEIPPDPTCATGTVYSGPFLVGGPSETVRVKAIACVSDRASPVATGTYTFGAPSPVLLSPSSANQNPFTQKVTVSMSATSGFQIRYEERGYNEVTPDPTCSTGTVYSGPFLVGGPNETVHVKAIACESGRASPVTTGTYIFGLPGSPTLNPLNENRNPYTGKISVSMSATAGFQIRYEDIGYNEIPPDPTCATGTVYSGPFLVG
ncbi:MAG: hypothetical protein V1495_11445, partial [Pseudomonadota bacterium]